MNAKKFKKPNILVLCHDIVGKNVAGPGIRYQAIDRELTKKFNSQLAVLAESSNPDGIALVIDQKNKAYESIFDGYDIIFSQWLSDDMIKYATRTGKILIFDMYAPVPIEYLASKSFSNKAGNHDSGEYSNIIDMYKKYISCGHIFTISNDRQKDFWVGFAAASKLIDITDFALNKDSQRYVVAPMGTDTNYPTKKSEHIRRTLNLKEDDFILLWTGGIWDWFDASTIVQSIGLLNNSSVKLVFMGTKHPNSAVYTEEMDEAQKTRKTAADLGLINKNVFFLEGWVPYEERGKYLAGADAAIYSDKQSLETRYSHRTRVLDHIWAGIPTICSPGDYMSELIQNKCLGLVAKDRTAEAFAEQIKALKNDKVLARTIRNNVKNYRPNITWSKTLAELVESISQIDIKETRLSNRPSDTPNITDQKLTLKSRVKRSAKILIKGH